MREGWGGPKNLNGNVVSKVMPIKPQANCLICICEPLVRISWIGSFKYQSQCCQMASRCYETHWLRITIKATKQTMVVTIDWTQNTV